MYKPNISKPTTQIVAHSPEVYPPITVTEPNLQYAALLSGDFASVCSELTAVMQYNYQKWILARQNSRLGHALEQIAMVEMQHLDMLGQLIVLLGGTPQYLALQKNRPAYWNGRMIFADTTLPAMLTRDIRNEEFTIENYRNQIKIIEDPCITAVLERIILDEEKHIQIFQSFLKC